MRVGQRLYLAVLPAVLGVLLVAALAYWGRYQHTVPEIIVVVAAIAAIASLVMAWRNTRYVAQRIERLAQGESRARPDGDELATIERVVDTLSSEVTVARKDVAKRELAASARIAEYAMLLAETSASVARRLDDVRLPLHILLENRFGDLNENQEEMLAAARRAAEEAESELQRLTEIAQVDQGALALRRDSIKIGDLIASLVPTLRARADRQGVRLEVDVAPALPRILGDPTRLRESLALLLGHRVEHTTPGDAARLTADLEKQRIRIVMTHGALTAPGAEELVARRLTEAHGGSIETSGGRTEIRLPVAAATAPARTP